MDIYIKNKQPVPAIYNVKQYTHNTDRFVFYIPKSSIERYDDLTVKVKTNLFTTALAVSTSDDYVCCVWQPTAAETATAGTFELQIEASCDDYVWKSYKAVLMVSDSVEGGGNVNGGTDLISNAVLSGYIDEGIIGTGIEVE